MCLVPEPASIGPIREFLLSTETGITILNRHTTYEVGDHPMEAVDT